jgi:hypothetical protein
MFHTPMPRQCIVGILIILSQSVQLSNPSRMFHYSSTLQRSICVESEFAPEGSDQLIARSAVHTGTAITPLEAVLIICFATGSPLMCGYLDRYCS